MSISLNRLQTLFISGGFVIDTFFVIAGKCEYVKCNSINSGETILVRLSRSYGFIPNNGYELKLIDFDVGNSVSQKYSEYPNRNELFKKYGKLIKLDDPINETDLESELESKYKKNLEMKSLEKEELVIVKNCFTQIRRVSLILTDLRYKLSMIHDKYLTIVGNDDKIYSFYISGYDRPDPSKLIMVSMDIEYFYEKVKTIDDDLLIIRSNMYQTLDKNTQENQNIFLTLNKKLSTVHESSFVNQKETIQKNIAKHDEQLKKLNIRERDILTEISELEKNKTTFYQDISKINRKALLEKQLGIIDIEKKKILEEAYKLKKRADNMYLILDNIEFDNCILINAILKNIQMLDVLKS